MNRSTPGSRLWPWGRSTPVEAELDPADVGTAFGLDLAQEAEALAAAPAGTPAPVEGGWRLRLSRRTAGTPTR